MLASTRRYDVATAMPGTWPVPSPRSTTSRIVSTACTKVATKSPIASWLGLSRRIRCTIRGENCPIASWTTTIVIVSTSVARLTIETAIVVKIAVADGRPTDELLRDRLIVEGSVEGDRAEGDRRAREDTHDRHEPKARPHADARAFATT